MSTYSKQKEYDLQKYLEKRNVTVIEYYGSRKLNKGDILAEYKSVKLRIDNKSCHQDLDYVRIQKSWLPKLTKENKDCGMDTIPIIVISLFGKRDRWCLIQDQYVQGSPAHQNILSEDWSWKVTMSDLKSTPVIMLGIDVLLMNVDILLRMIDENAINVCVV
jgi:hypothetical protein